MYREEAQFRESQRIERQYAEFLKVLIVEDQEFENLGELVEYLDDQIERKQPGF